MNVSIEGKLRLVNFDVANEVGPATALVKNIPVTVTDGKLNIDFSANVNRPMVNAVSVYSFRSTTTAANNVTAEEPNILDVPGTFELKAYPNPMKSNNKIKIGLRTPKSNDQVKVSLNDVLDKLIN